MSISTVTHPKDALDWLYLPKDSDTIIPENATFLDISEDWDKNQIEESQDGECRDWHDDCDQLIDFCYKELIERFLCPESCGFCTKPTFALETTPTAMSTITTTETPTTTTITWDTYKKKYQSPKYPIVPTTTLDTTFDTTIDTLLDTTFDTTIDTLLDTTFDTTPYTTTTQTTSTETTTTKTTTTIITSIMAAAKSQRLYPINWYQFNEIENGIKK